MISDQQAHIEKLFTAELQFRLASAVRLAVTFKAQPLDLPTEWTHGKHSVKYEEVALRQDQAEFAACFLHRSAAYLMAVAIKDAIRAAIHDPKTSPDSNVRSAYQVARLIRNAFTHDPFSPRWAIDADCQNMIFSVSDILALNTANLNGSEFDWRHYGGPLALFRLSKFVRFEILKEQPKPRKEVPVSNKVLIQQGDLVLQKVDKLPPGAKRIELGQLPDGGFPLGGGHIIYPTQRKP